MRRGSLAPLELRSRGAVCVPADTHLRTPQGAPVPPPPAPAHTWADQAQKEAGRGALRFLPPLPPLEQRRPVPSPWAAALHNRGSGAGPAAARGVTLHLARAWAAALLTASPSVPGTETPERTAGPRGSGLAISSCRGLRRRSVWSAPGLEGKERLGKTALHADVLAFIHSISVG